MSRTYPASPPLFGRISVSRWDLSPYHRVWRLALIMGIAMVASVFALRSFPAPPTAVCPVSANPSTGYLAALDPTPRSGARDYQVRVAHSGFPVGNAQFCLQLAMIGMPEMNVNVGPLDSTRLNQVRINFDMAGPWAGAIMLVRNDKRPVAVPIYFTVE